MNWRRLPVIPVLALLALCIGAVAFWQTGDAVLRDRIWLGSLIVFGAPVVWRTARGVLRGAFAADIVATLAIVGAALLSEPLAGLIVVIMQTGGEALEAWAVRRASNAVAALEADAPRSAQRVDANGAVADILAADVVVGDTLLIRPGALVPCDVLVLDGQSAVDTSRLTGEPLPVLAVADTSLPSGAVNGNGALTVRAQRVAADSQYARIVDLVRSAQASKSPLQRTADRWAIWFTPLTLLACAIAWWVSRDTTRVLAVLVVATPCPLILAAPVAIIAGISRAAKRGIVVRHGGALEALASITTAVFDKTGTVTVGRPLVSAVVVSGGGSPNALLQRAAAVEQGSGHLLGRVVVAYAQAQGLAVPSARGLQESAGRGVMGNVDGVRVAVGSASFVREALPGAAAGIAELDGQSRDMTAFMAAADGPVGRIEFADTLRANIGTLVSGLQQRGVAHTVLLSGDQTAAVARIAAELGITEFAGDLRPEDKTARVAARQRDGERVLMVGDGTNDAPALSTANVGVALAGHGGGVSAEAADVVLLVDEPMRVLEAIDIGQRSMRIARQSIATGVGLSVVGMVAAAAGYLTPTAGAIAQEVIDVAVILNALRAAGPGRP